MTKTIQIPLSSESCSTIKHGIGWFLWLGATAGLFVALIYMATDNILFVMAIFPAIGIFASVACMLAYLKDNGHWIEFQCNCDGESDELSGSGPRP